MRAVGEGERSLGCDGRYWTRLTTREAYAQEGHRQAMAIGSERAGFVEQYLDDGCLPPLGIWSLREAGGLVSYLTAELDLVDTMTRPAFVLVWVKAHGGREPPAMLLPDVFRLREFCQRCDGVFLRVAKEIDEKGIVPLIGRSPI